MKARNWLNNNSAMVTILAVVILILSLGFIIISNSRPSYTPRVIDVYYYDLGAKQLFVDKSDKYPPIATPTGEMKGARAYVFSCGDCKDESKRFVGYLEMYTPAAKDALENPKPINPDDMPGVDVFEEGRMIRGVNDADWVKANSMEAFNIQDAVQTRCGEVPPKSCLPSDE